MSFIGFKGDKFSFGFQIGTDHLTRRLPIQSSAFLTRLFGTDNEVWETINNNEMKLFTSTPEVFIPIMRFAEMFSNGRFVVKDWKTNEPIENHELLKLLEKPNPLMNRNEWLITIAVNHWVYGNCYIYKNQYSELSVAPTTLMILPNEDLKLKVSGKKFKQIDKDGIILGYELSQNRETFEPKEIIHLKNYSVDGIKGVSILEALQMPVSNARGAYGFNNVNLTKRGALGILSPAKMTDAFGGNKLGNEDKLEIEKQFVKDNGIFDNQTPIKIANVPVDYTQMSLAIKEQLIFETINQTMKKVIDSIGLNVNIFSDGAATFNNADAFLKSAYQDAIIPFAEKFCFALNDGLNLTEKGLYIELDYSFLPCFQVNETQVATEMKMKAEAIDRLIQVGYSRQEAETLLGITKP
jgi:HK97 family phage portal protein